MKNQKQRKWLVWAIKIVLAIVTIILILLLWCLFELLTGRFSLDPEPEDLGMGFTYVEDASIIFHNNDYSERKDKRIIIVDYDALTIPPKILSYNNTEQFLLVKQHPRKYEDVMFKDLYYPHGRDTVYYWFIDKAAVEATGPFIYSEMMEFLKEQNQEKMLLELK